MERDGQPVYLVEYEITFKTAFLSFLLARLGTPEGPDITDMAIDPTVSVSDMVAALPRDATWQVRSEALSKPAAKTAASRFGPRREYRDRDCPSDARAAAVGAVRQEAPLHSEHAFPTTYYAGQATRSRSRSRSLSRSPRGAVEARQRRATSEYAQAKAEHVSTGEAAGLITIAQHMVASGAPLVTATTGAPNFYTAPVTWPSTQPSSQPGCELLRPTTGVPRHGSSFRCTSLRGAVR